MPNSSCPPASEFPDGRKWILQPFHSRYVISHTLGLLKSAALLEYPQVYLDYLRDKIANHHYGDWDEIYKSMGTKKPKYDLWLDKHDRILKESSTIPIIDLGCGYGNDTLYLHERGYAVISCDFSMEALKRLNHFINKPVIRHFDMLAGLPFENGSARVVIADLSIHYFLWKDTERIVDDIRRVLTDGGHLLCRVNSIKNMHYTEAEVVKIEENYYDFGQRKKRFFDRKHFEMLFREWDIAHIEEYSLERFRSTKVLWEIAIRKPVRA